MVGLIYYGIFLIVLMGLVMAFSCYVVGLGKVEIMLHSRYNRRSMRKNY